MLLKTGDLPSGWKATTASANSTEDADNQALYSCLGLPDPEKQRSAHVTSSEFDMGDSMINSEATSYQTSSALQTALTAPLKANAGSCVEQVIKKDAAADPQPGVSLVSVQVKVTPGPDGGPDNVVADIAAVITIKASGKTVEVKEEDVLIRGKNFTAEVDFSTPTSIEQSLVQKLVTTVATRAAG